MVNKDKRSTGWRSLYFAVAAVVFAICLLAGPGTASSTISVTPRISLRYSFNDNVYAVDPDMIDPGTASYLDYLAGITLTWRDGKNTFDLTGDAGFEQFLTVGGFLSQSPNRKDPSDFNSVTSQVGMHYRYAGRVFTFEFADNFSRSRDLSRIFGISTDALGYWTLSTSNVANVSVRYSPSPRDRNMLSYYYDTLFFADQSNLQLFETPDSVEHRILYRGEYDFTPKTTGIFDLQAADRNFSDLSVESSDYRLYQGLGGLRFNLREQTYLELLGGYVMRDFYNVSDVYKLENTQDGIGRITFVTGKPKRYNLQLTGERGVSIYGDNLFFVYNGVSADSKLYLAPKVAFKLVGSYRNALYDLDRNDRTDLWKQDRVDNIYLADAALQWDILEKEGEGTLTVMAGYTFQFRDSNIDSANDYVNLPAGANFWSYDTQVGVAYAQIQIKPTILFGNR